MRILGLDYGEKTLGVAVSDELKVTARELETIERERPTHLRRTFARLEALIEEYGIQKAVLGLPLNMDGSEGDRAEKTRAFAEALERRTGLEIIF
ncbi:MAG: Holliday junction resolvase RuvX, partial [Lachnospiraceae bacterium]|nr:Holliday junction resolvase RuvX [Lachnospiraceae bacterium]